MLSRILFAIFALIAGTTIASAYDVRGWEIQPIYLSGQFQGCSMLTDYDGGTRMELLVMPKDGWGITLSNATWNYRKGLKTPMSIYVDGQQIASGTAEAI